MNANLQSLLRAVITSVGAGYAVQAGVSAECVGDVVNTAANVAIGALGVVGSYAWSVVNNRRKAR